MNSFPSKYYFCLVMLLIWQPIKAASQGKSLTLKQCITYGLENDFTFKIQALKLKQAEKRKASQATRFLPLIEGYLNHQYTFGSAIDPNTNSRTSANFQYDNLGINTQINLFNFSELWESKLQTKNIDIEQAQSLVIQQEYTLSLIEKFYAAMGTQNWLHIVRQQLQNTEQQLGRITAEVKEGLKPESDIYDIQVVYTQEKKTLIALEQEEVNRKNELLQWMNYRTAGGGEVELIHENIQSQLASVLDLDQNVNIDLEKRKKEKLEFEQQQLLSNFLPRLTLDYSYSTFFSQQINGLSNTSFVFGNQLKNNKSQYLGLGVRIPLFSRGDNLRLRAVKKIAIDEQQLQIEKSIVTQQNLHDNYYRKLQQYQKLAPVLHQALDFAEKSLETTQAKYTYGKVDISAYKVAKNQVLSSSYDIINNDLSIHMSEQLLRVLNQQY